MKLFASTMPSIENVNRLMNAKKRALLAVFVHVAEGINVDRAADAGDDEQHHQAQARRVSGRSQRAGCRWKAS